MSYCPRCGKELPEDAAFCPACGLPVNTIGQTPAESGALTVWAMIFAFLIPVLGLVLSLVGMFRYKSLQMKGRCKTGIFLSVGMCALYVITYFALHT